MEWVIHPLCPKASLSNPEGYHTHHTFLGGCVACATVDSLPLITLREQRLKKCHVIFTAIQINHIYIYLQHIPIYVIYRPQGSCGVFDIAGMLQDEAE